MMKINYIVPTPEYCLVVSYWLDCAMQWRVLLRNYRDTVEKCPAINWPEKSLWTKWNSRNHKQRSKYCTLAKWQILVLLWSFWYHIWVVFTFSCWNWWICVLRIFGDHFVFAPLTGSLNREYHHAYFGKIWLIFYVLTSSRYIFKFSSAMKSHLEYSNRLDLLKGKKYRNRTKTESYHQTTAFTTLTDMWVHNECVLVRFYDSMEVRCSLISVTIQCPIYLPIHV